MKLTELLIENNLRSFASGAAQSRLGPNNPGAPGTVAELKRQLQKFQLEFDNQPPNPQQKAWIGDMSDEWSQALTDAVIQWKTSILRQDPNARVDVRTPEFSPQEIQILLNSRLYGPGSPNEGLLIMDGGQAGTNDPLPTWTGRTLDLSFVIDTPVGNIETTRDMLAAISFNGWAVILDELLNKKGSILQSANVQKIARLEKEMYAYQNAHPRIWLQSWEDDILQNDGERLKATFANGNEKYFHPLHGGVQVNLGGRKELSQKLYAYFKELGNGLLRKYEANAQANQARAAGEGEPETVVNNLSEQQVNVWAIEMKNALAEGWISFIPGVDGIDETSVKDLMNQLKTPDDWNNGSARYQDLVNEDLAQRLADALTDEDYESIVFRPLASIGRINHNLLHSSIVFGLSTDSLNVEYENDTFTIMKAREANKVIVKKGSKQIKNAVLIDDLLRIAIEETGGSVPDFNVDTSPESIELANTILIAAIQEFAPWMVPYYVKATPFDESTNPQMGVNRLRGLSEKAAQLVANGLKEPSIFDWIGGEIKEDADWLVDTKAVHFDKKWAEDEGSLGLGAYGNILDDIDAATDEEKALLDRIHREETRMDAFAELANTNDLASRYERIYRLFKQEHGETIDQRIFEKKTDQLTEFVMNGTPINDEGFALIMSDLGASKAAPFTMAKIFEEAMLGPWWTAWIGTDEEKIQKLVSMISDPEDYTLINEYYKALGNGDLIDDIDSEYLTIFGETDEINRLKAILGIRGSELATADLDPGLLRELTELGTDQSTAKLERIKDILERPKNNYFVDVNDGEPDTLINSDKVETVYKFFEEVANGAMYDDDQKEIWFDILEAMDVELQRVLSDRDGRRNRNRYEDWSALYNTAKQTWFS